MIIIYHAVQLRLAGRPDEAWSQSSEAAAKALEVLRFCGELDPVARKFTAALSSHYECLRSAAPVLVSPSLAESTLPQSSDYLFETSPESSKLHDTSCQLFIKLCHPYNDEHAMAQRKEGDVDPRVGPSAVQPSSESRRAPITAEISNLEDGYFVGSSEPSWWLATRSSVAYSRGATAMKVL